MGRRGVPDGGGLRACASNPARSFGERSPTHPAQRWRSLTRAGRCPAPQAPQQLGGGCAVVNCCSWQVSGGAAAADGLSASKVLRSYSQLAQRLETLRSAQALAELCLQLVAQWRWVAGVLDDF